MPFYPTICELEVEADSPEDAALKARDQIRTGKTAAVFIVDFKAGKVIVDTELGNESVIRDDRKKIGPLVLRKTGPTGVLTSPVLADFYGHDKSESYTDIERIDGRTLRLRGFGPEAYYEWLADDGTSAGELIAAITVVRDFGHAAP